MQASRACRRQVFAAGVPLFAAKNCFHRALSKLPVGSSRSGFRAFRPLSMSSVSNRAEAELFFEIASYGEIASNARDAEK
jgi:hypothetical protein